jgi:hypothetical protein
MYGPASSRPALCKPSNMPDFSPSTEAGEVTEIDYVDPNLTAQFSPQTFRADSFSMPVSYTNHNLPWRAYRSCLVPKIFKIFRHIECLNTCMEH